MIRKEIRALSEYRLAQHAFRIKLNQNENPYELPREIKEEVLHRVAAQPWSRYPAFVPAAQIEQVARFAGWRPDGTLLGNGSNDLLQLLFTCMLERGQGVVISQPTFTLYKILARTVAADVHEVPMTPGFAYDIDRIIHTARRTHARLIVLCSPNNPTGTCLEHEAVTRVVKETEALVILDEAYGHFSSRRMVELLPRLERLAILQTFSKAMGAAGIRFGYALLHPPLAEQIAKAKLPYSVNLFTLTAVEVLLERWGTYASWIDVLIGERERVYQRLSSMSGLRVYRSGGNFLLFETLRRTAREVFEGLLAHGILIRDVSSYPMLERGLRVTIGTPEECDEFLAALEEVLS
jgi:histidinol-phosphate aminotransferase